MKKKKALCIICLFLICVTFSLIGVYYNFNRNIDKSKVENENLTKGLSMMLETKPHSGVYEMAIRDKWPTSGYLFNETLSKCENGGTLEWDDVNKTVKVHTSVSDKCYVYFDVEPPDVYIATSNLPTTYGATGSVTCSSNGATYNQKYNRIEISSINTKYEDCSLTYTEPTSKTYLNDYIIGLAGTTHGNGQVVSETADIPDYSTASAISESSYTNQSIFLSYDEDDTSGTEVSGVYSFTDGKWTSDASAMTSGTYYHFKFTPNESGYYQMCYELSSGSYNNKLYVYVGSTQITSLSASSSASETGCIGLGYVSNNSYIKVVQRAYDTIATLSFSIDKAESVQTNVNAGMRYEGKNPNNYIWFNNELWRIIGVFDSGSHGQSNTNLVKIMRADSIGGLAWDKSGTNDWTTASLNSLLNGAYYNAQDGTNSGYCYMYSTSVQANCDYRTNGIQDGYRDMIQNVTWYLGGYSSTSATAESFYGFERGTTVYSGRPTETTGYIGLMYPSDYGYSALSSSCARTTNLGSSCGGQSWIAGNNYEWMLSPYSSNSYSVFELESNSGFYATSAAWGWGVRPVLYLKADVYYIDGDGSIEDPIIIAD